QPHLYRNVPVYLWPWVWWQLFQIECWIKETGRMVLGGVARDGKVYVLHVADDPNEPKPWSPRDLKPYRTRHDAWLRSLSPCGEVGFCEALRCCAPRFAKQVTRSGFACAMDRAQGCAPNTTSGHCGVGALSPVHRAAGAGDPLSRVRRRRLARVRLNPLSQAFAYNPTRHGDQLMLATHLLERPPMLALTAHNTPSQTAPPAQAQPPPISDLPGLDPGPHATSPD
ncbi:MAG: hypothetical protein L3J02_03585, partial [Henriciella sp.]|nr:hypothetical protein [Henriciella sp.]